MPKNPALTLLQCDLCTFSSRNHFIFNRHRHRCLRVHGLAAKGSSPSKPRKCFINSFTEIQNNPFAFNEDVGTVSRASTSNGITFLKTEPSETFPSETSAGSSHSKYDAELLKETPVPDDDDEDTIEGLDDSYQHDSPENADLVPEIGDDGETPGRDQQSAASSNNNNDLPPPNINRNYRCYQCGYNTTKSKAFLYHQIDEHKARLLVYPCNFCEYATRYKHKLSRHIIFAHKKLVSKDDVVPENRKTIPAIRFKGLSTMEKSVDRKSIKKPRLSSVKSIKTLNALLLKLKSKGKVTDACLSAFYTDLSSQQGEAEAPRGIQSQDYFKCNLCLFTGKSKNHVVRHIYACHVHSRLFRCNLCHYETSSQIEFYAHKNKHSNKNSTVHKCPECSYATDFKPNFDRHMTYHGSNKPQRCSLCSYATVHEGALKRHVTSHHPNTTQIPCDEELNDTEVADKDSNLNPTDSQELDSEGFRCPMCSLVYRRCADLNRHMKTKHNIRRKDFFNDCYHGEGLAEECSDTEVEFSEDKEEKKADTECRGDKRSVSNDDEEESRPLSELVHKRRKLNLKCSYCSYIAKWPSDLRRHLLVHSVEKRFKCTLCWKKYKYLGDLNVHLRRDHEVNPDEDMVPEKVSTIAVKKSSPTLYRCPGCPFTTKWKAEIERHSHMHKDQKAYVCKLCDYQTYWRGDMGRHLYRRHPDHVSKDVNIKEFFEFHPERKIFVSRTKDLKESMEEVSEEESMQEKALKEPFDDVTLDNESIAESISSSSSFATVSKDGTKMFKCNLCSITHTAAYKIRAHMESHYNIKPYQCPVCGRRANWKYDVRRHIKHDHPGCTEDVVTLSVDKAKATIKEYMETMPNIRRDHHLNAYQDAKVKPKTGRQKYYQCAVCSFYSRYRLSVTRHLRSSHPNQAGPSNILVQYDDSENPVVKFPCRSSTMRPGRKPGKVGVLKRPGRTAFSRLKSIRRVGLDHRDGSEKQKLYMCSECGKQGTSKGSIKKHYNYIHPNNDVRIVYLGDGTEFNYYTGLPTKPQSTSQTPSTPPASKSGSVTPLTGSGRADSRFSNPKEHGYSKPFQCSICGQRSNWKWDLKKHLRMKHPGKNGFVIVMQLDEAQATFSDYQKPKGTVTADEVELQHSSVLPPSSGTKLRYKSQEMKMGRYRRYKCSACGYRSNWRTDIIRHIDRRHGSNNAKVIFLDVETARQTIMHYIPKATSPRSRDNRTLHEQASLECSAFLEKTFSESKDTSESLLIQPDAGMKNEAALNIKVWHCPKCQFSSHLKSHIIKHFQEHGLKPFYCIECGFSSLTRSDLYQHIRSDHQTTDYSKFAKIMLKFSKTAETISKAAEVEDKKVDAVYVDAYLCRLCNDEFDTKSSTLDHLEHKHSTSDENQALMIRKRVSPTSELEGSSNIGEDLSLDGIKRYYCTICPYRTDKKAMLSFHHTYHRPSSQNKFKCKFCPYYVSAPRLLNQHTKWHEDDMKENPSSALHQDIDNTLIKNTLQRAPTSSPYKFREMESTPKKHCCEKCPYTTNSKNDFLYHKQFHRPKPAAEYKCELCDYWVMHRRLLKQHTRLHGVRYFPGSARGEASATNSPSKSLSSDASAVYDAVEIAAIKQKMIACKITASLSSNPTVSPLKIATQCSVGNRSGLILRNGSYRKLHQCAKCPYTNVRARNLRLHELMHGPRKTDHPLMKCPHCDYYVGSKGLLSHHMKVHLQNYRPDPVESTTFDLERREGLSNIMDVETEEGDISDAVVSADIPRQQKVDTLLEILRFKKFSCEKCPYASAKRSHFTRHMELHGSRQRHTCEYCDYSVPSASLLTQHHKIHLMPNQNLLATQSFSNLQHMNEVPADVALASALPPTDMAEPVTISVVHDHLDLYENDDNNSFDLEPKKLYRCDRCPYANVRRDHLLTHLRFHLHHSSFKCPYCDYSAPKQQLLTQHIRVHFCPLPELSDWLMENGQADRMQEINDIDLGQALEVAEKFQVPIKQKMKFGKSGTIFKKMKIGDNNAALDKMQDQPTASTADGMADPPETAEPQPGTSSAPLKEVDLTAVANTIPYICQYCDREFLTSKQLISHEMQHLIGNHFEVAKTTRTENWPPSKTSKIKETIEPINARNGDEKAKEDDQLTKDAEDLVVNKNVHIKEDGKSESIKEITDIKEENGQESQPYFLKTNNGSHHSMTSL